MVPRPAYSLWMLRRFFLSLRRPFTLNLKITQPKFLQKILHAGRAVFYIPSPAVPSNAGLAVIAVEVERGN